MARKSSKMVLRQIDPKDLIPYENNPRFNEQAIEQLMVDIPEFGFTDPIVVDADMVILAGHTRREAAIRLGMDTVPVHVREDLTGAKGRAFRLAHNKAGEIAGWDFDKLDQELEALRDEYDMSIFGFDMTADIDELFAGDSDDTFVGPAPAVDSEGGSDVGVLVNVDTFEDAQELLDRLSAEGYTCKII